MQNTLTTFYLLKNGHNQMTGDYVKIGKCCWLLVVGVFVGDTLESFFRHLNKGKKVGFYGT